MLRGEYGAFTVAARRKPPGMLNTGWTTEQVAVGEGGAMMADAKAVGRKGCSHLIESRAPRLCIVVFAQEAREPSEWEVTGKNQG